MQKTEAQKLRDDVCAKLDEETMTIIRNVMSGSLSHEDYKYFCGMNHGIGHAVEQINESLKNLNKDSDDS